MANCTDCNKTYQAYLSDLPSEWRTQIADLMCKVVDDVSAVECVDVRACETLTSLSAFTLDDGELCITYKDERGTSVNRCIELGITTDDDFIQNQFSAPQSPGTFWIAGAGRLGNVDVTSATIPDNGLFLPAADTLAFSANGLQITQIEADGLMTHSGDIFLDAAISSQPAISFFLGTLALNDYFIQRRGTTIDLHGAGIVQLSVGGGKGYEINANTNRGHEWLSMTSPTNNNLMQLFPDGGLLLMTTTVQQTPDPSAILKIVSTDRGVLFPNMTTAQKNAITSPTSGLVVYDTDLDKLCVYTTAWQTITSV